MLLTLLLEDEEGLWTLRLHPDQTWELSRQRVGEFAHVMCQGSVTPAGEVRGEAPRGAYPKQPLEQFSRVLAVVCR